MPRGGLRQGAGRPGLKAQAELCLHMDIRTIQRAGMLQGGYVGALRWKHSHSGEAAGMVHFSAAGSSVRLDYGAAGKESSQSISITRTRCHFGGSRPWFVCPIRGERVAILYARDGRFACRRCQRVAYQSQSEDGMSRMNRKLRRIEAKIGPQCKRPKGMHRASFERLLDALCQCEDKWESAMVYVVERCT